MSRTVYVVERVVFEVSEYERPATFYDWTGSNGDHIARVPVAAFADRAAAETHAAALGRAAWDAVSPARFGSELDEPRQTVVRDTLRRHGFDPPVFHHWDGDNFVGESFPAWWAANAASLSPAALADLAAVFGDDFYRVEARELED